jgi:hypothetical protein
MPASQLVSAQHGIIAWSKNADGDAARLVVQTTILVRRSMEPTGRGAASNIGQPIPTVGVPATTTLSEGYWVFAGRTAPRTRLGGRVLPIDEPVAEAWALLGIPNPLPLIDGLLVATAKVHSLIFVTRNVADIAVTGVPLLDPFSGV